MTTARKDDHENNNDKLIKLQRDWFPAVTIKSTRRNRKIPPKKSNYTRNMTGHPLVIFFAVIVNSLKSLISAMLEGEEQSLTKTD